MYSWVFITIFAAAMQTTRASLQKSLTPHLTPEAITWARFGAALPIALCYIGTLHKTGTELPNINIPFLLYCLIGGVAQIVATIMLISLFSHRNFAVGMAYAKTEAIQTAILGALLLGETISLLSTSAILIGVFGIMLISIIEDRLHWKSLFTSLTHRPALIGIRCGIIFAIGVVCIRQANLSLESENPITNAALTFTTMICMQVPLITVWMIYKDKKAFSKILSHWKPSALIGIIGFFGSIGYFTALAMTKAAYVIAVGQIEIIFSVLITHNIFKEHINRLEILGMTLVIGSILLLIYSS